MKNFNKAFTLIELLTVVAIIGILATVILLNVGKSQEKAKVAKAISSIDTVKKALGMYRTDTRKWPASFVASTSSNPLIVSDEVSGWGGPYIDTWPKLPWGADGVIDWTLGADKLSGTILLNTTTSPIPDRSMQEIDYKLDDNNLNTGNITKVGGKLKIQMVTSDKLTF